MFFRMKRTKAPLRVRLLETQYKRMFLALLRKTTTKEKISLQEKTLLVVVQDVEERIRSSLVVDDSFINLLIPQQFDHERDRLRPSLDLLQVSELLRGVLRQLVLLGYIFQFLPILE